MTSKRACRGYGKAKDKPRMGIIITTTTTIITARRGAMGTARRAVITGGTVMGMGTRATAGA